MTVAPLLHELAKLVAFWLLPRVCSLLLASFLLLPQAQASFQICLATTLATTNIMILFLAMLVLFATLASCIIAMQPLPGQAGGGSFFRFLLVARASSWLLL